MAPAGARRRRPAEPLRIGFTYNVKRVELQGRQRRRGRIRRPRDHRRHPRRAGELRPRGHPAGGHRRAAPAADGVAGRSGVQHRRGRLGPQPRGGGAGAVRADGHPLHRLGRRHAVHRPRQGAVQAGAARARHPDPRVPGDGDRARAAVAQAEVPADREAQPGGLDQGGQRPRLGGATTRRRCGRWCATCSRNTGSRRWSRTTSPGASSRSGCWATSARGCCRRWRSCSGTRDNQRPVYDYQIKQEWEKHVYYECPAKLTPAELKGIERVCARDLRRPRLPGRGPRRPAHERQGRHLRARGEPAARADPRLLRSVPDRQGGQHRLPLADRRDPGRRSQAAAGEAPGRGRQVRSGDRCELDVRRRALGAHVRSATNGSQRRAATAAGDDRRRTAPTAQDPEGRTPADDARRRRTPNAIVPSAGEGRVGRGPEAQPESERGVVLVPRLVQLCRAPTPA